MIKRLLFDAVFLMLGASFDQLDHYHRHIDPNRPNKLPATKLPSTTPPAWPTEAEMKMREVAKKMGGDRSDKQTG